MKAKILPDLVEAIPRRALARDEIALAAADLLDPSVPDDPKAAFLAAWAERGESAEELAACAEALLPLARDPGVRGTWNGVALLDCCGTGGGGLDLINISTGLMFVLSALGIPVIKHGNRGITKKSGSADVLEALGIQIDLEPKRIPLCLEEVGCAFLFAPAYHPAFATIAPVRRALGRQGKRTIFNLLGPVLNPARPDSRLVGVFKVEHLALYKNALEQMACPRFTVACGEDAPSGRMLGEASAQGRTRVGGTLRQTDGVPLAEFTRHPASSPAQPIETLLISDAREGARRLLGILSNEEQGLARETLAINAALAAWTQGIVSSLEEGVEKSHEALSSGRALERLHRWREFSQKTS